MASYHQEETAKGKRWLVRFRIINEDGKTVQKALKGFKTKKAAEAAYNEFMQTYIPPIHDEKDVILFEQVCNEYIKSAKNTMKESSVYEVETRLNNHIIPAFRGMPMDKITANMILSWQNNLNGYSQAYKVILRRLLNSIFLFGNKFYNTPKDAIYNVDMPRSPEQEEKEMQVWSPDEFAKFCESFTGDAVYKTFFRFLFYTGCRKGEALALTKDCVMIDQCKVKINKSLTRKIHGATYKITTPKNKQSNRTIVIPSFIADELKELMSSYNGDFVFGGEEPIKDRTIDRQFQNAIKAADIKKIRIHDLRHSHASYLVSQGCSIVSVSQRLGHKDTKETLNTYSHFLPQDEEIMKNILERL